VAKAKIQATDDPTQDLLNKQFGEGSVMTLSGADGLRVTDGISTGSLKVDDILGGHGFAFGRFVEIIGPESSGKSSLCHSAVANAQKRGMTCVIVDAEQAIDPVWAINFGVDLSNVKISQPDCGEEGLTVIEKYLQSGRQCFIVVDSIAALVPRKELEGEFGDVTVGIQARMMSQACKKLTALTSNTKSIVVWTNQIRSTIGPYQSPETTPGGRSMKFYASQRLDLRRKDVIKKGERSVGIEVKAKVIKNKVAVPFRETLFRIYSEGGIRLESEVLDLSIDRGFIEKSGAWVKYEGKTVGQGEEGGISFLEENPEVLQSLIARIKDKGAVAGGNPEPDGADGSDE